MSEQIAPINSAGMTAPSKASTGDMPASAPDALLEGRYGQALLLLCALYSAWHLYVLNVAPLETWTFRILHVAGALMLGFCLSAVLRPKEADRSDILANSFWTTLPAMLAIIWALLCLILITLQHQTDPEASPPS